MQRIDAEFFGSAAICRGVVNKKSFLWNDTGLTDKGFKNPRVGLHHSHLIRYKHLVEIVFRLMARLGEEVIYRLIPVHRITVAQEIYVVFPVQTLYHLQALHGDTREEFAPRPTYLLVGSLAARSAFPYLPTELCHIYLTKFKVEKHVYLLALVNIMGYLSGTDALQSLDTLLSVEVYDNATEIED